MNFLVKLDSYQKSLLFTSLLIIIITSINTEAINIGNFSFLFVLSVLFGIYYFTYTLFNYISYSSVQISSILILIYLKKTIYSSIPIGIYVLFISILFITIFYLIEKKPLKLLIYATFLTTMSIFFFNQKQIFVEKENEVFKLKNRGLGFNYYTYAEGKDRHRKEYQNPDFISPAIDASKIMKDDWNQSKIKWREKFWGFNKKNIPLNGRLWVPKGDGKFPIISIIHGNHSMQEFSDDGYNYLGEFLSENGYIVNSVDQNFLNGSWDGDFRGKEMTTRAWQFLENLHYLKSLNEDSLSTLFNKIDFNQVIVVGHSRGGEAVNIASRFNNLSAFPDNGNVKFNYNFNIIGIVTIAPTDYRYDRNYDLKNINYMSIQGSMDSDEESFFGLRQSNRMSNTNDSIINVNILIEGANHSQFNTSWGRNDTGYPSKYLINNKNIIPDWFQRKILKYYLYNFVEYISGKDLNADKKLIKSFNYNISNNRRKKIISRFKYGGGNIVNDFEGDDILFNGKINTSVDSIESFMLKDLLFRGGKNQQNSSIMIKTKEASKITFEAKNNLDKYTNLGIDISNTLDSTSLYITFYDENNSPVDSLERKLFNTKINLNNYKFNYLTKRRFKKLKDINFNTYIINVSKINFSSFDLSFSKKGEFYIDNIILY